MIDRAHGGNIRGIDKIMDFSANINPLGLPPGAKRVMLKNISGVMRYPEPDSKTLKIALGDFHKIEESHLVVGNGSIELIYLIPKALRAKNILIITPSFSEYEFSAGSSGGRIIFFDTKERDDFKIDLIKLEKYLKRADILFLGNPNNPTGLCVSEADMLTLVGMCAKHKTILVVDESFIDFTEGWNKTVIKSIADGKRGIIAIRSLTKFFALPGLRIGYAIACTELIKKISRLQYPWNINSMAQAVGTAILKDTDYMNKSREYVSKDRSYLFEGLNDIEGLKVFPSDSNFILCKMENCAVKNAKLLNNRLFKQHLVVRDCGNFRGLNERFFRVAVRRRDENRMLLAALRKVL